MLERIEREKNRKLVAVKVGKRKSNKKIQKTARIKDNNKSKQKILYEQPGIKEIARIIEFNELDKCLNTNLRIESKKTVPSIAEYISDEKISKQSLLI